MGVGSAAAQAGAGTRAGGLPGDILVICPGPEQEAAPLSPGDNPPRAWASSVIRMVHGPGR